MNTTIGLEVVSISEFCDKYKISDVHRKNMGILNENVKVIEEEEYNQLLNDINKVNESYKVSTLKRKFDSVSPMSRDVKCKLDIIPLTMCTESQNANNLDDDIHPEIILTSELNGNTQFDISGVQPYQDIIMDSDDTCRVINIQQDILPIQTFMPLTSDDHQWQSSPFNFS
ncbi:hypothetical protein, no similarity [Maudiozyma saulgeensis]|uniref:Uncharacterized protein n=1 Tax=Maudiozyma saulgeensis TaxID=1789683 RepID=A0A1X7R598_9SACH|nr:hypothetical protein, no similarity [Kazachstania saulgeensis]